MIGAAQVLAKMILPVDNFALEKALGLRAHHFPLPQDRLRTRIRRAFLPGLGVTLASGESPRFRATTETAEVLYSFDWAAKAKG